MSRGLEGLDMFDILIIKKIEEDEERRRQESARPRLSVPSLDYSDHPPEDEEDGATERGVVIIDPDDA